MDDAVLLCVDLQNDFASEAGLFYKPRPCVDFILKTLFPSVRDAGEKVAEIVSDYRQPRPGDPRDCCRPGEFGYGSLMPDDVRMGKPWIKSMNSPVWTRENAGIAELSPGIPRPEPDAFKDWLEQVTGDCKEVVLFGLTLDRCVLATAQELTYFGYEVKILEEATDTASGSAKDKEWMLRNPPLIYWTGSVSWNELTD